MSRLFYMLSGIAVAAAIGLTSSAEADNEQGSGGFIGRDSRIKGCIAIVDDVRNGVMTPTEWLQANKEDFRDLEIELKQRKYSQAKAKDMMMGMAISLCMERKGYWNKCIADGDNEDADLQTMQTASIYSCWKKGSKRADAPTEKIVEKIVYVDRPVEKIVEKFVDKPVYLDKLVEKLVYVDKIVYVDKEVCSLPPPPRKPDFTANDLDELRLDVDAINAGRVVFNPLDKYGRLKQCTTYWRDEGTIRRDNRTQEAYQIVVASKLERCMAVTGRRNTCASFTNVGNPTSLSMNDWEGFIRDSNNPNCYR